MRLSLRKNGLTSLFKEVRVFKGGAVKFRFRLLFASPSFLTYGLPKPVFLLQPLGFCEDDGNFKNDKTSDSHKQGA